MDFTDYKALDAINASSLKDGMVSMKHMQYALTHPKTQTDAMRWGSIVHLAILEPARLSQSVAIWHGGRRAGKEWDAFKDGAGVEYIVTEGEYAELLDISAAVHSVPLSHRLISESAHEVTLQWDAPEYGKAKARLDGMVTSNGDIVEVKTIGRIADFSAQFARMNYDLQLGWYREGARITDGRKKRKVWTIAIESCPPYDVAVYQVPVNVLNAGYARALEIAVAFRDCQKTGIYPGTQAVQGSMLEMPPWYGGDVELDDVMPME